MVEAVQREFEFLLAEDKIEAGARESFKTDFTGKYRDNNALYSFLESKAVTRPKESGENE